MIYQRGIQYLKDKRFYDRLFNLIICLFSASIISISNGDNIQNNDPGFSYYSSWKINNQILTDQFWKFKADSLSFDNIIEFNKWHLISNFKDISPKISNAYFLRSPWPNNIYLDYNGNLVFKRKQQQKEAHTMIELSINNQSTVGNFVNYGGYRSMMTGIPYKIELDLIAENGSWINEIPWLLVFQAHAIPDVFDIGKKPNPPFALIISKGRWEAHIRADSRLSLPRDKSYQRFDRIDLGKVEPNTWTRFTIKVMWGSKDYPEGKGTALGIWRNNKLYHEEWGVKNFYNNLTPNGQELGPYLMVGAYTPSFNLKHETITIRIRELIMRTLK